MAAIRKVKATFSSGRTITRGSKDRIYTHAWLYVAKKDGQLNQAYTGFSTSANQARKNAERESAWTRRKGVSGWRVEIEVVEVEAL